MEDDNGLTKYTDAIGNLGNTAGGLIGALTGRNKTPAAAPTPAPAKTNWTLIGGIGAAVLVVVVLIAVLAGRR